MSELRNKLYRGLRVRAAGGCVVTVNGVELDPRFDLRRHSPDGFQWGYGGSGPAQLALALCADALEDDERAQAVYQAFKFRSVATLATDDWEMTADSIRETVQGLEATRGHLQRVSSKEGQV
jgi:hypothetical protein